MVKACDGIDAIPIRIGGDEFVIVTQRAYCQSIMDCVNDYIESPCSVDYPDLRFTVTWGKASQNHKCSFSYDDLYKMADSNLYNNKDKKGVKR